MKESVRLTTLVFFILCLLAGVFLYLEAGLYKKRIEHRGPFPRGDGLSFNLIPRFDISYPDMLEVRSQGEFSDRSFVELRFNDVKLDMPNRSAKEISLLGNGAFSLWNGTLIFSIPGNPKNTSIDDKLVVQYPMSLKSTFRIFFLLLISALLLILVKTSRLDLEAALKAILTIFESKHLIVPLSLFLLAVFITLFWIDQFHGVWNHDSGYFLKRMFFVERGVKLYSELPFMYPSLMIHIGSQFFKLNVSPLLLTLLIPASFKAAISILSASLAFLYSKNIAFSILVSVAYLVFTFENQGTHLTLEHGVVLFVLLAFIFQKCFDASEMDIPPGLFVGFLLGLSALSKQIGILFFLPLLVLCFSKDIQKMIKRFCALVAGLTSSVFLFLWLENWNFLAIKHELYDYFKVNMALHNQYSLSFLWKELNRAPTSLTLYLVATIGFVMSLKRRAWKQNLYIISLICLLFLLTSTRYIRDYPHYSLNCWPILALGILFFWKKSKNTKALLTAILIGMPVFFIGREADLINTPKGKWQKESVLLDLFVPASDLIKERLRPNETLLQLGAEEILEVLSKRIPQNYSTLWDDNYLDIPLFSKVIVLFDYGQEGAKEVYTKILKSNYALIFEKSLYGNKEFLPVLTIFEKK